MIDDEQVCFRAGCGFVDHIFTLKQIGEKAKEKKRSTIGLIGGESEWFRIDSGVRQGCIISPWLFNVYMDRMMKR